MATLVTKAGDNLTAEECWAVQAASVASFYNNSQGSNPILNLYIPPHSQAADILRRSLSSPSDRFVHYTSTVNRNDVVTTHCHRNGVVVGTTLRRSSVVVSITRQSTSRIQISSSHKSL